MQLIKKIRLIWTFYCSFIWASLAITTSCTYLFWAYDAKGFAMIFWFKVVTLGLIFYYINFTKSKEYFYYQNLGVSKKTLWVASLTFDFSLYIFLLTQTP